LITDEAANGRAGLSVGAGPWFARRLIRCNASSKPFEVDFGGENGGPVCIGGIEFVELLDAIVSFRAVDEIQIFFRPSRGIGTKQRWESLFGTENRT